MEMIEKTAETIEAAVEAGLRELGVSSAEVMIEVLEEPSRGVMGIGAKPARVRIIFMGSRPQATPMPVPSSSQQEEAKTPKPQAQQTKAKAKDNSEQRGNRERGERGGRGRGRGGRGRERNERGGGRAARDNRDDFDVAFDDPEDFELPPQAAVIPDAEADEMAQVGKQVLVELLAKMQIDATVTIHKAETAHGDEGTHWILNVSGKGVNALVGRRGDTLSSLQYIVRLMLSRRLQRRSNVIVDVGEYKLRRTERLRDLANRMADQAVKQGRTITLEPMPPNERRIIHLTLRERQDVQTKSVGEGNSRKVTIVPTA
jgi:spoIIIJ-associated protein